VSDVHRFRSLVRSSYTAAEPIKLLREALGLWRDEALIDIRSEALASTAAALGEEHLDALERRIVWEMADGRHTNLVGELAELSERWPLREQLWVQLMTALFRSGRQADALAAYAKVRVRLREELGVEPGPDLRRVHAAVLAGTLDELAPADDARHSEPASTWTNQRQLPIDVTNFVGREETTEAITRLLLDETAVPVVVISGLAGVGKSALATHVAHRVREAYPDGQWHLRLGAGSGDPRTPEQLLDGVLRSSGVTPAALPDDLDAMSALLRARLADRRVLLVLDDAMSTSQVAPLLPGTAGCAVIVTSRNQLADLTALHSARPYPLTTLAPADSRALLESILGSSRLGSADADAARDITELCGHLPLALRIAAANLLHQPELPLARYAHRLRRNRLGELSIPGSPVALRDAFDISVASLSPTARQAFAYLGGAPVADLSADAAAALFGVPYAQAKQTLDTLCAASLAVRTNGGDRYGMHDLVRYHAAATASSHDPDELAAALDRLFTWYWQTVEDATAAADLSTAARLPHPTGDPNRFADGAAALSWLDSELPNLVAVIVHTAEAGPAHFAWELADALRLFLREQRQLTAGRAVIGPALAAAETAGNPLSVAAMQHNTGVLALSSGDRDQAQVWYERAIAGYRRCGFALGEAVLLSNIGVVRAAALDLEGALEYEGRAIDAYGRAGRADLASTAVANQSSTRLQLGQLEAAVEDATAVLEQPRTWAHAVALINRAAAYGLLGRLSEGYADATAAVELCRERGRLEALASALLELARRCLDFDRHERAIDLAEQAMSLASETADEYHAAAALAALGTARRAAGHPILAIDACRKAIASAGQNVEEYLPGALITLAAALYDSGEADHAKVEADRALQLARRVSARVDESRALSVLAVVHHDLGEHVKADEYARGAAKIAADTGYVPAAHELRLPTMDRA
jgi:tetratricopeptide (TPR) repeat protein